MAPPYKNKSGIPNPRWWANAYETHADIDVEYQMVDGKDIIEPSDLIKFKYERSTFKFRCVAYNVTLDRRWIDCLDSQTGEWRSFPLDKFKGKVKPRKRRVKKNAEV